MQVQMLVKVIITRGNFKNFLQTGPRNPENHIIN